MTGIPGSPPDLRQLPSGCVFHPRCPYALDRCAAQAPPLTTLQLAGGRTVACWLHEGAAAPPAELARPEPLQGPAAQPDLAGSRPAVPANRSGS